MKLKEEEYSRQLLMIVCLFKVFHDAGITILERCDGATPLHMDYYYEFALDAIQNAAPIVYSDENLYTKHGFSYDDDEVNLYAYSSKEFKEYYRIARKLHRIEGCKTKENPYIKEFERKIERLRGFDSYNFDYFIGGKRKGARLEALWGYEFDCEIPMCLWIVRVMSFAKAELPKIQKKYREARRKKRSGGKHHAIQR